MTYLRTITAATLLLLVTLSASAAEHTKDTLEQVKKRLADKTAVLIDVREQREWNAGHLKNASLVPLSKIRKGTNPKVTSKDVIIYCHCRSGGRVIPAADILQKRGFDVRPLKAGFEDLLKAGFKPAK
ncbi:MAG TPA: rhodanese-like domain-containing protein [Planctomycetaceae bacterium]|nr:rhodanese [Blastopirellula sp.]HAY80898.1 rhodanese-like domain-containing protein [Planctomycetaceae bacterium]